jgi:hypothetical protein
VTSPLLRLLAFPLAFLLSAAAPPVTFTPAEPDLADETEEYRQLWAREGNSMIEALEEAAGVPLPARPLEMIVYDGRPMAPYGTNQIWLNGDYPGFYKRATLVHELGHRLSFSLRRTAGLDDHRLLYLFLYDAWADLYGHDFADRMVRIERRIPGSYDYDAAWTWALALTPDERRARLRALCPVAPAR